MTQREKMIAGAIGVVVVLFGGYALVAKPYWIDERANLERQIAKERKDQATDNDLIKSVPTRTNEWNGLRDKGLVDDLANSGADLQDSILSLAQRNRVSIEQLRPTRVLSIVKDPDFTEYKIAVNASGSSRGVWPFVYALESSQLPLRIDDLQIRSRKDGIDDLTIELNITTLVHFNSSSGAHAASRPATRSASATRGASARGATTRGSAVAESRPASPSLDELEAQLRARRRESELSSGSASTQPAAVTQAPTTEPSTQPSPTGGVR